MKKINFVLPILIALSMLTSFAANAGSIGTPLYLPSKQELATMSKEDKQALGEAMKTRVDEIKAMDKSELSKEDRKALKKELKAMHRESRAVTGVYISVGALIIIILLLIIIL